LNNRIIIGISGASGVIYGVELLRLILNRGYETHLIITDVGKKNIEYETDYKVCDVEKMADYVYDNNDITSSLASGSFITTGMIIAPCSIKTLSGIANSYADNLLIRVADVALKERRKLILMVRETPLHIGHLHLMLLASELGALILPPVPSFYHKPEKIEDIIHQTIGKMFDYFGIQHDLFKRWEGVGNITNNKSE